MRWLPAVRAVWTAFDAPWFVCGGCALDVFMGSAIRPRDDIDIGIFRADAPHIAAYFSGADFAYATPGRSELSPWDGRGLQLPVHEIHVRTGDMGWEVLLNEKSAEQWVYRRDPAVTRPLDRAVLHGSDGVRYLAPEIVLLYKSKHMRAKDSIDYDAVIDSLATEQRSWLMDAICRSGAQNHPWL